jgi:TonB family protein
MHLRRFLLAFLVVLPSSLLHALEPDEVYAKVSASIVILGAYDAEKEKLTSLGSGVIVAPGQIVTNCHVIEGADVIFISREKHVTVGIVRYSDPDRDLCQIGATEPAGFEKAVTRIKNLSNLKVGQKVYAIGAPQGLVLTLSDGLISSLRKIEGTTIIQTTAPISQGSSGGGLFDTNGQLIGITSFIRRGGQNLNFALPATWVSELPIRHRQREEEERKKLEEALAVEVEQERLQEQRREAERVAERNRLESERKRLEQEQKLLEEEIAREAAKEQMTVEEYRRRRAAAEAKAKAEAAASVAHQRAMADWRARIQAKIRGRVVLPANMEGNPEARFEVVLIPGGDVLSTTLRKSSGNPAYDAAVERAIHAAQPLPVPEGEMFQENFKVLQLVFRPKE